MRPNTAKGSELSSGESLSMTPSIFAGLRDRHTSSALQSRQATDIYMQIHEWTPRPVKDRCIDNRPLQIRIASVLSPGTANEGLREHRGDSYPRWERKLAGVSRSRISVAHP